MVHRCRRGQALTPPQCGSLPEGQRTDLRLLRRGCCELAAATQLILAAPNRMQLFRRAQGFFLFVFAGKTNGLCDERVFEMKSKQRLRTRPRRKANCTYLTFFETAREELAMPPVLDPWGRDLASRWDVRSLCDVGGENELGLSSCEESEEDLGNNTLGRLHPLFALSFCCRPCSA